MSWQYMYTHTCLLLVASREYRYVHLHTFQKCGLRFFHENMLDFEKEVLDDIIVNGLRIQDVNFKVELRPLVQKIALQTRDTLINNKKSPFRDYLKKCE